MTPTHSGHAVRASKLSGKVTFEVSYYFMCVLIVHSGSTTVPSRDLISLSEAPVNLSLARAVQVALGWLLTYSMCYSRSTGISERSISATVDLVQRPRF